MIRLVISGIRGRMGQAVARIAAGRDDVRVVAGITRTPDNLDAAALHCDHIVGHEAARAVLAAADVVIDFTQASATHTLLQHVRAELAGKALVVGTTGLSVDTERALDDVAHHTAVLVAANFSIGVNLLLQLTKQVAAVLDAAHYDAEIVELHHAAKVDAPSGTALAFARAVAAGRGDDPEKVRRDGRSGHVGARPEAEIGLHAVRGGSVIGEHHVLFLGAHERLELKHAATDRALFAEGALHAARWLAGRAPGRYSMADVLDAGGSSPH